MAGRLELPVRHLCCGLVESWRIGGCREVVKSCFFSPRSAFCEVWPSALGVCAPTLAPWRAANLGAGRLALKSLRGVATTCSCSYYYNSGSVSGGPGAPSGAVGRLPRQFDEYGALLPSEDVLVDRSQTKCGARLELFVSSACCPGAIFLIVPEPVGH